MPRSPRIDLEGMPQHVTQRGNNRQPCFFNDDDYRFYLECLQDAAEKYACLVHAYILMTNHVHILATPEKAMGLSRMMQSVGRRYVQYINYYYNRTGTLWEGRYKSCLIDADDYLFTCYRYIELNPVRAGMVTHPADYPWSSYQCNALGKPDPLIQPHANYKALGDTKTCRASRYKQIFHDSAKTDRYNEIAENILKEQVMGTSNFKDQIEQALSRSIRPQKRGRPGKQMDKQPNN